MATPYVGRFAPSPTGLLHAGSLVAALASWLDARAHGGRWLVRIEDVDTPRCAPGAAHGILEQLRACGLWPDDPVLWQSQRGAAYQEALDQLTRRQLAYPCVCTRKEIAAALAQAGTERPRHADLRYPGTCRSGLPRAEQVRAELAWRLRTNAASYTDAPSSTNGHAEPNDRHAPFWDTQTGEVRWYDRGTGWQRQNVEATVGDFVLQRADGLWAYQLAVVVDDAAQGITHVVRGQDLADNTARQILLQWALSLPQPSYLHTPLVRGPNGDKLSKQTGAEPLVLDNTGAVLQALNAAAAVLGLAPASGSRDAALAQWVEAWAHRSATGDVPG